MNSLESLPPRKEGCEHSERVLVYYPAVPEARLTERWSIAYYHYCPPFSLNPEWVDLERADSHVSGRAPVAWWSLPKLAVEGKIPDWSDVPSDIPVSDLREFLAPYGPDISVLITWSAKARNSQFVTVGSNRTYADKAVELRNLLASSAGLGDFEEAIEDRRGDHPNVALDRRELSFFLSLIAEYRSKLLEGMDEADIGPLVAKLESAKAALAAQPH